jgi:hypothetical protein
VTGGGYGGARGVATQVAGTAGMLGAGALLLSGAGVGVIALGPVGLAEAGAAVLGYGARLVPSLGGLF